MSQKKSIILSLGGSIIFPETGIDVKVLKKYKQLIKDVSKDYNKIFIICGGGTICRKYQKALKDISDPGNIEIDWMGLYVTRLNGTLIRLSLGKLASKFFVVDPTKKINFKEKVLVGAGSKPGWSTDFVATKLAETYGAKELLNLSNIKYVYDKDPKKYKDAKPMDSLTWEEMGKMIPRKWKPGLHSPFDPVAFELAKKLKLKVGFLDGTDVPNVKKYFEGRKFRGTIVN